MEGNANKNALVKYMTDEWQQLPEVVKRFTFRALMLLLIWFVGYYCIIKPDARIDNWMTKVTTDGVTRFMNQYYGPSFSSYEEPETNPKNALYNIVNFNNQFALKISHPCNAFDLFLLYVGFLICVPGNLLKKLLYTFFGVLFIFVLNVLRCCALVWLNLNKPEWTDFAHHYAFTTIVYLFIFFIWVMFLYEREPKG